MPTVEIRDDVTTGMRRTPKTPVSLLHLTARLLASFALLSSSESFAGNVRWHDAGTDLVGRIYSILIEKSVCSSRDDCIRKNIAFFAPRSDGLDLSLYSIAEPQIVAQVSQEMARSLVLNKIPRIRLRIYQHSKQFEVQRSSIFASNEFYTLDMRSHYADR
jgi:hypothetical protein